MSRECRRLNVIKQTSRQKLIKQLFGGCWCSLSCWHHSRRLWDVTGNFYHASKQLRCFISEVWKSPPLTHCISTLKCLNIGLRCNCGVRFQEEVRIWSVMFLISFFFLYEKPLLLCYVQGSAFIISLSDCMSPPPPKKKLTNWQRSTIKRPFQSDLWAASEIQTLDQ